MKPSLGRIVLVTVDPVWNNGADVAPAVITRVLSEHPDGSCTVNLRVLVDSESMPLHMTAVLLDTEERARALAPSPGAYWPPRV